MAELRDDERAKIRAWVDAAPPMSDATVARVARLLTPYAERTAMPTIRDTATVRPSKPVDGQQRRRRSSPTNQRRATTVREVVVDPQVMAAVEAVRRPGQRLVIVSATEVRLVNG